MLSFATNDLVLVDMMDDVQLVDGNVFHAATDKRRTSSGERPRHVVAAVRTLASSSRALSRPTFSALRLVDPVLQPSRLRFRRLWIEKLAVALELIFVATCTIWRRNNVDGGRPQTLASIHLASRTDR